MREMSQREASLKEKLEEKESDKTRTGSKGKDENKPRSLRSRLMKRLAEEESNSPKRFRNAGSLASEDVAGKSPDRIRVQPAVMSTKNVSYKSGHGLNQTSPQQSSMKDAKKPALKEKHSAATLRP